MIFVPAEKLHFVCYLSLGLLSLPLLTECNKIRLVGPSRCSGRVEVSNNDVWGTVCDDQWSITNADVVCRELNCGSVLEAKKGAFFGEGQGQIWLDDVQCVGSESSVFKCSHRPLGQNNCGHSEDAGVICSGSVAEHVRVVNGSNRCNGRVEVHHIGKWNTMCTNEGSAAVSEVVCRETNCGSAVTPAEVPYFGESPSLGQVISKCFGNESSLKQCTHQENKESCVAATVVCSNIKPIRILNGTGRCSGRLEIYHDGQWGTICDDRWGMQEATVACQQLDCGTALSVKYKAHFGRGKGQVWLDDLDCTGHEMSIADCPHRGFGEHDCDHNEDASVVCSEWIRLMNGTDRCSGRVEVFHDGKWAKICKNWGNKEAAVVCQEMDCGSPKASQESFHFGDSGLKGYTTRCSGNVSSISQCTFEDYTGRCEGVSLSCSGVPSIRLVNGTDRCSGRVEVHNDGQWGTVCDDEWDIRDAQVVCRSMDCGTALTAKSGSFFGPGHGPNIWLDDLGCFGNETSLFHCRHPTLGENNCGHSEDAGVVCSADIRLINGTDKCSGRVEFYHGGQWSSASNQNWGTNEASVVCREMNCGDPVKFSGSYGRGGQLSSYRISCSGRESSLAQCTVEAYARSSQDRTEEASVTCSGNVKLSDGHHRCAGRVEFFDKGQWRAVCGESWDTNDANVVCRQLNCGTYHKNTTIAEHGHGSGETWNSQFECRGSESTLSQCPQRPFSGKTCNTTSVAGVVCTGSLEVRLVDGKDECQGRVEVRHGEVWQTVCDTDWNMSKAQVVCERLECGHSLNATGGASFGQGIGTVVEANSCFDNETTLQQCSLKGFRGARCGHDHDAGAHCAAPIRMVGGSGQCSGRVEVLYKGQWGTVCDDEWGLVNAHVVCRQLGCGHAVAALARAHFGRGTGPIWLDNVECAGEEAALTDCDHAGFGENDCHHSLDAGVICFGSLEKPLITFSPAAEVKLGERVKITCTVQNLGGTFTLKRTQSSFKMKKFSKQKAGTFFLPNVDFNQSGSYFCKYQRKLQYQVIYYPQGNTADLTVTVKLEKPSISLTSAHAMVIYSPDKISVPQGSSFSITCSIHSSLPRGIFYLKESHSNTTLAIPAFDHSVFFMAYFEFPEIEYQNQGEYSCVYTINISSRSFSSDPSKSLRVTVVATSSSVALGVVGGFLVVLLLVLVIGYLLWRRRKMGAGTLVRFSNRFGGAIKQNTEDMNSRRVPNTQVKDHAYSRSTEDNDADDDTSVERVSEDLDGRICYDL